MIIVFLSLLLVFVGGLVAILLLRPDTGYVLINYDELARLIGRSRYYDPSITIEAIAAWIAAPSSVQRPSIVLAGAT